MFTTKILIADLLKSAFHREPEATFHGNNIIFLNFSAISRFSYLEVIHSVKRRYYTQWVLIVDVNTVGKRIFQLK